MKKTSLYSFEDSRRPGARDCDLPRWTTAELRLFGRVAREKAAQVQSKKLADLISQYTVRLNELTRKVDILLQNEALVLNKLTNALDGLLWKYGGEEVRRGKSGKKKVRNHRKGKTPERDASS